MFFSVIVAALELDESVMLSVNSVLKQTFLDSEIVIQVKKSAIKLAKMPVNDRLRVFFEDDDGIYDALNRAVLKARGKYILFLGGGDYLADNYVLESFSKALYGESDGVWGGVLQYNNCNVVCGVNGLANFKVDYKTLRSCNPIHTQGLFINKKWYLKFPFDNTFKVLGDYEFLLRSRVLGSLKYVPRPVSMFMLGGASTRKDSAYNIRLEAVRALRKNNMMPSIKMITSTLYHFFRQVF
jgi:glycosyltransferase involved in cell wall biosynthesis